jgi:hypothetical protein
MVILTIKFLDMAYYCNTITLINTIFVTSKLFSVSNVIFTLNSKMQIECFYHPSLL